MPPHKKTANAKLGAPPTPPLSGAKIVLCGTFPNASHSILKQHVETLGADSLAKITPDASHLITTLDSYNKPSVKVKAALQQGIHIVNVQWLLDCATDNARKPEASYIFPSTQTIPASAPLTLTAPASGPTKRPASSLDVKDSESKPKQPVRKKPKQESTTQKVKTRSLDIPVDDLCPLAGIAAVYVDDNGVIWDASLNQTNSVQNNNKFYRIQVLDAGKTFQTWTRWGRVGENGQHGMLGNGGLNDALKRFQQKFKDKSGIRWEDRCDDPIPGKYAFVEKNYQVDSGEQTEPDGRDIGETDDYEPPACSLPEAVKGLMDLIFNRQFFAATMTALNYDANKLPLGKLSKTTISRGFQALKDLSALLDNPALAGSLYNEALPLAIQNLSNLYYSVIPHAFGRNRPPIINDYALLKKEVELLESLSDMKDAELLMKVEKAKQGPNVHPTDKLYQELGMKEMTTLDHGSTEFHELVNYLVSTRGSTHNVKYKVQDIFRIERQYEKLRFDTSVVSGSTKNKRLLWHGSRVTNFAGILNQGLRIAPPEAPVSGYMFGKGIYLADMSSKSANYCCSGASGGTALLLLCEADLGSPVQELVNASYTAGDDAKAKGLFSTLGQGQIGPSAWKDAGCIHEDLTGVKMPDVAISPGPTGIPNAHLLYNEYIVYDVSQIRLRYLFRVSM